MAYFNCYITQYVMKAGGRYTPPTDKLARKIMNNLPGDAQSIPGILFKTGVDLDLPCRDGIDQSFLRNIKGSRQYPTVDGF